MILDGKALADQIKEDIRIKIAPMEKKPGLAVILAGYDPASMIYVRSKERACAKAGIYSEIHRFPENVSEQALIKKIMALNDDEKIHGILVQLPLPKGIDEKNLLSYIDIRKDVDGFLPENAGNLFLGNKAIVSCTPKGIIRLIKSTGIDIKGKKAVVVGRSNIVGKPVSILLLNEHATVTICHSRTQNLSEETQQADILIAAVGKAHLITKDMVKRGTIVIDVGINRIDGKLCGDVDFDDVKDIAAFITPVPGGVGPMTIAMLLENTVECCENITKSKHNIT
ncbi:MAG: bifunctional methylenetetrahydrofolate dehydrogenase/methenyltetrahydrofolate cyclohydrolase FolD [Nanoarchaeota archaeon]|nr:bifunctional methylenetetrahydrofolate dehydrogenase/methenyltetrahydrofolate cyclohydrolase FolD [Nanoarchaeota archaeon]